MEHEVLIDKARMAELASLGDPSLVKHVIDIFFSTVPDQVAQLRAGVAAGDAAVVRSAGHTIKGGAASAGFPALSKVAGKLEDAGREGLVERFGDLLTQLEDLVARTERAVETDLA